MINIEMKINEIEYRKTTEKFNETKGALERLVKCVRLQPRLTQKREREDSDNQNWE